MKKYLYLFAFIFSGLIHSQSSGITYQAVIYNPSGEELPGQNNMTAPLTEQDICLRFNFIDSSGGLEYQEVIQVTTDVFGMVNVIIGNDIQTGGYAESFEGIVWDGSAKNLVVKVDVKGIAVITMKLVINPLHISLLHITLQTPEILVL